MSVGTLLNNPEIRAVAVEPNEAAVRLLKRSLKHNQLESRCQVFHAAVGADDGVINFDGEGSVTGHIAEHGQTVQMISLSGLLNRWQAFRTLVKMDIEGFESQAVQDLKNVPNLENFTFLVEFHEQGFNGVGDPASTLAAFQALGGKASDLGGVPVRSLDPQAISQLVIEFSSATPASGSGAAPKRKD